MDGRPSADRALDFSADIGLIGPTPYALHTHGSPPGSSYCVRSLGG